MSYTIVQVATPGRHLDGRERSKPLPPGVTCKLLKQVGPNGHRKNGDCFIEFFYDDDKARTAHMAQRQGL